ncbi:hypothetical protein EZV62_007110 [Acer yangbiense]|uniref:Splicing factor YJU2 n=1 Tax=Acer yangbiense TaxID=1000413 RepID=A0A5C7I9E5_9ROSI|nr:hypothetical protein EZV62_007110 [Acer yangbiense]
MYSARFYFKCTKCSAELTMKTDPQNSDYIVESGATRNFEPWRAEDESRHATVSVDAMLEILQSTAVEKEKNLEEEDEALIRSIFHKQKEIIKRLPDEDSDDGEEPIGKKGKLSEEVPSKPTDPLTEASVLDSSSNREKPTGSKTQSDAKASLNPAVRIVVVKKPVVAAPNTKITTKSMQNNEEEKKPSDASIGLQSLGQYDSDDDE